jgi:uncharacterized protein YndB with AHSA1/START domain
MTIGAAFLIASLLAQTPAARESTDPIVVEVLVNASAQRIWDAFTTSEGIQSWMVVKGDVDLRIGGLIRTSYRKGADLDGETAIHQSILSIDPGRMLSYRTLRSPKDFPFADTIAKTWTVIYLDAVDSGRTRVTVKMLRYTSESDSQKMRAFFEIGNKTTLDALAKRFAAR